jgi:hypothetical protein
LSCSLSGGNCCATPQGKRRFLAEAARMPSDAPNRQGSGVQGFAGDDLPPNLATDRKIV